MTSTVAAPAVNNYLAVFTTKNSQNTIPNDQVVDNSTLLLKAGCAYKIEGGVDQVTATSGIITDQLIFTSKASGANLSPNIIFGCYGYIASGSSYRNYNINCYFVATEDTYLKVKVTNNTLVSNTSYETKLVITEYATTDVSLANMTINGKSFDNNNNIDLEGLSTLAGYSSNETLTENRWIDGKPIYRKVITYTMSTTPTDDLNISTGVADGELAWISNFKQVDSTYVSGDSYTYYVSDTSENRLYCSKNGSTIYVMLSDNNTSLAGRTLYITLEYTKTSDTSSSPVRLVGSGNGTAGIVSELPALTGSEGKLLRVNANGLLEWFDDSFVGCSVVSESSTTLTASTAGKIKFTSQASSKVFDTHNGFDYVNSRYVAPVSGYYDIIGKTGYVTGSYNRAQLHKNGAIYKIGTDSSGNHSMVNDVVYLNAGDYVELYGFSNVANTTYTTAQGTAGSYLTVTLKK